MRHARLLLGFVLALPRVGPVVPAVLAAQDVVPKELALALIRWGQDGGDILVGAVPRDLVNDLPTPRGGRVLGSFVSPSFVQVVIALPGSTDSALAYARRTLVQHGWRVWQPPAERGGLQYRPEGESPQTTLCRVGSTRPDGLTIRAAFYGAGTSLLRLTRTESMMCDESASGEGASMRSSIVRFPFSDVPPLFGPAGARAGIASCRPSSTFRGSSSQSLPLRTPMRASEILAHYGRQLDSAGWKPLLVPDGSSAAGSWTKADSLGPRAVTITIAPMTKQSGCYNVNLTMAYD